MKPLICEDIAPPEVFDMLHELNTGNEASAFVQRTLHFAEENEGLCSFNIKGEPNSRTLALMFMMQARMTGEADREQMLIQSELVAEISGENDDELENWDGICLALLFASDELLDRMISKIPPNARSIIISQMPAEQHGPARSMFTT